MWIKKSINRKLPCTDMIGDCGCNDFSCKHNFWNLRVKILSFFHPLFAKNDNRVKFRTIFIYNENKAKSRCIFLRCFHPEMIYDPYQGATQIYDKLINKFRFVGSTKGK